MSTVSKKQISRRRLAAYSFLSNISLDGTHRDTKIGIYNLSLQTDFGKCSSSPLKSNKVKQEPNKNLNDCQQERLTRIAFSEEKLQAFSGTSPRERVNSCVTETKTKFLNSKKKTPLSAQNQAHYNSAESLGLCSKHTSCTLSESSCPGGFEVKFFKTLRDVHDDRIVLLSTNKAPCIIFSCLPYIKQHSSSKNDSKQEINRRRPASGNRPLSAGNNENDPLNLLAALGYGVQDGQVVSFRGLLTAQHCNRNVKCKLPVRDQLSLPSSNLNRCQSFDPATSIGNSMKRPSTAPVHYNDTDMRWPNSKFCHHTCGIMYTPNLLDDPELVTGKHSTVLTFSSYISSIIDYVKPSDLKKELNEKFKERFPRIHLTLSKLRSLKREMLKITHHECGIDLLTVAQAYVFFEKLILKMLINKQNRKPCAAACLLLSAKLNDVKGTDLKNLLERMENGFRLNHRDLISCEFGVLVALEFSLHVPTWEIFPHYQRLLYES